MGHISAVANSSSIQLTSCRSYVLLFSVPNPEAQRLLKSAVDLIPNVCDGHISLNDALLQQALESWCATRKPYCTANLWIMTMHLAAILRSLIQASRTRNWKLYHQPLRDLYFHSQLLQVIITTPSHLSYSLRRWKSSRRHIQLFIESFQRDCSSIVIHCSDRYRFGIFSDLCIKQVLMGSIESVRGLTREREPACYGCYQCQHVGKSTRHYRS